MQGRRVTLARNSFPPLRGQQGEVLFAELSQWSRIHRADALDALGRGQCLAVIHPIFEAGPGRIWDIGLPPPLRLCIAKMGIISVQVECAEELHLLAPLLGQSNGNIIPIFECEPRHFGQLVPCTPLPGCTLAGPNAYAISLSAPIGFGPGPATEREWEVVLLQGNLIWPLLSQPAERLPCSVFQGTYHWAVQSLWARLGRLSLAATPLASGGLLAVHVWNPISQPRMLVQDVLGQIVDSLPFLSWMRMVFVLFLSNTRVNIHQLLQLSGALVRNTRAASEKKASWYTSTCESGGNKLVVAWWKVRGLCNSKASTPHAAHESTLQSLSQEELSSKGRRTSSTKTISLGFCFG